METLPRVAVILVNYGGYAKQYLRPCYEGLCSQSYPKERLILFIADNGSSEESRRVLRELAPTARILASPQNGGWTGGLNTAVRAALGQEIDYLVILNMDTHLDKDWLRHLAEKAGRRQDLHILQSKILISGTNRVNSVGNRIHFLGYGNCNGYGLEDSPSLYSQYAMDYASGAAMLIKREVFERIGLFREEFFIYYDDQEFCWRARLAGYNIGLAEQSVCYHEYHFQNILDSLYLAERNRLTTLLTLERAGTLGLILPCLILVQAGSILYFTLQGRGPAMLQLLSHFWKKETWRTIRGWRRENNRLRVRRDSQIVRGFSGIIVFAEIKSRIFRLSINPLLWAYWAIVRRFIFW